MLNYKDDFDRCMFCAEKAVLVTATVRACYDCAVKYMRGSKDDYVNAH